MRAGWTVDRSGVSMTRRQNGAGTGSSSMTVHGSSMGLAGYTARGRGGTTGCEGTEWESETAVRCLVGHGAGGTRRVVMTAGERGGSMTAGWSVDRSGVSMTRREEGAGTGSGSLAVHGSSMGLAGYTVRGREGATGCEGTEWESETSVRCLVGQGAGGTRRVVMTAGQRGGSLTEGWSVDGAGVSLTRRQNRAGTGSGSMTVHGSGMGLAGYTARGREGQTGCEGTERERVA